MCAERVLPSFDRDDNAAVLIDRQAVATTLAEAATAAPWLFDPAEAVHLARVVNHLTTGMTYEVIADPDAFAAAYRAAYAAEDPDAPVDIHGHQLTKFALPDLGRIEPPRLEGSRLVFFAQDTAIGLPYRIEAEVSPDGVGAISYESLPSAP